MSDPVENRHLRKDTIFVPRVFNHKYVVKVPTWAHMAGNVIAGDLVPSDDPNVDSAYDYEKGRTASMAEHLRQGDILFDIGVNDGWLSAVYSHIVGPENMCLFEPTPWAWPNILATWEENGLAKPKATFCGFVSNRTNLTPATPDHSIGQRDGWPDPAYSGELIEFALFRSIKDRSDESPQTTVDSFVDRTGIIPRGISVDVEGAEFVVLQGSEQTLRNHHPLLWLSLHTINGALAGWGSSEEEIRGFLRSCGYGDGEFLEVCGDAHWFWE